MLPPLGALQEFDPERSRFSCGRDVAAPGRVTRNLSTSGYERDVLANGTARPFRKIKEGTI